MTNSWISRWLPLAAVLLFVVWAIRLTNPPRPVAATAPATAFSAERALREVAVIARQPHSLGTPEHDRVRDYLVQRCRALGLRVQVQDTTVVQSSAKWGMITGARVQNVVALLPGRTPGGRGVLVLSHYDSQPHTPGAGDDAAGVAAALETLRALRAGPPLAHDVRWVFTDGEEVGLMGACAYTADSARLRREVGVVLNYEGRGNEGPSSLFEVGPGNGWVISEFAKAAAAPLGSSLAYEIYRHLPNDTDFTPFRKQGLPGLNFAFTGGYSFYHSPVDTPGRLDLGSLQHHGENMLPTVRHFASIALRPGPVPDHSFFNPLGTWFVHYDARWNYLLDLLAGLLLLAAVVQARRRGRVRVRGLLGGALAWVGGLLLLAGTGWVLTQLVAAAYPQYAVFYDHTFYTVRAYHLAYVGLGVALFGLYYAALLRWLRPDSLVGGSLLVVAALLALVQWAALTTSFLLSLPLLFGAAGWWWATRPSRRAGEPAAAPGPLAVLLVLPAVALLAPALSLLLTVAGLGPLVVVCAVFFALLLGLLLPVLLPLLGRAGGPGRRISWALPALGALVAVGALFAGHARSAPTAALPQQTHLLYVLDADSSRAYWVSNNPRADAWTGRFLSSPTLSPLPALYPGSPQPVLHQQAPRLPLAAPTVEVLADSATPTGHRLRLRVRPGRPDVVSLRLMWPQSAHVLGIAGHALAPLPEPAAADKFTTLLYYVPGPDGVTLEVETAKPGDFRLLAVDRSLGLPTLPGSPPLPATMIPAPGYNSFTTQVLKTFRR